ncbi:hypothetical protein SMICM17S_03867 [Streptomyces microflavus]
MIGRPHTLSAGPVRLAPYSLESPHDHRFRPDRPVRHPAGQPHRDGPDDPEPGGRWRYGHRAHGGLLRPARLGRARHHRRHPALRRGPGLPLHPRAAQPRAGRLLAQGHRRGARRGRPDLRPDHARGPHRPPGPAARGPDPGQRFPGQGRGPDLHPRGTQGLRRAARADRRRDPADHRRLRRRRPQRHRRRVRRRGAARRQRLPHPPVPRAQHQPAHRRVGRLGGGAHPVRRGGRQGGRGRDRRRPHRAAHLALEPVQRHRRARPGRRLHRAGPGDRAARPRLSAHPGGRPDPRADPRAAEGVHRHRPDQRALRRADRAGRPHRHRRRDRRPDLVRRALPRQPRPPRPAQAGGPFNTPDPSSFFGGDAKGYTDYPALDAV